jgi:hypothetical protein
MDLRTITGMTFLLSGLVAAVATSAWSDTATDRAQCASWPARAEKIAGAPRASDPADGSGPETVAAPIREIGPRLTGDTVENPILLEGYVPFCETGNTCEFENDYDEACPYTGSTARDVVYAYQPQFDEVLSFDLCQSAYDTKIYVYADAVTPGYPVACNDDVCGSDGYRSRLDYVTLLAGHTYYIVIDGYGNGCGAYTLVIAPTWECVWCSPGAIHENEPDCYNDYNDTYNGGCHCDPPAFTMLQPSDDPQIEVCGRTGTYDYQGEPYRDTDWYQITLTAPRTITWTGWANVPFRTYLLDGRQGCAGMTILDYDWGYGCDQLEIAASLDPGTYWLWLGPNVFEGIWCGEGYQFFLTGYTPDYGAVGATGRRSGEAVALEIEPNPVGTEATLHFSLRSPGPVTLEILDPAGRLMNRLLDGEWLNAGDHALRWPGERQAHGPAGSGIWFCRLLTPDGVCTRRVIHVE